MSGAAWVPKVGDKGKTREGSDYEVMYVAPVEAGMKRPVLVQVKHQGRAEPEALLYFRDGTLYEQSRPRLSDLMPPTTMLYLNVYKDSSGRLFSYSYETEEYARQVVGPSAVMIAFPVELPL